MHELLSPAQMASADQLTIESGNTGIELMENAGSAVADTAVRNYPNAQSILIFCGTGNNGGDGFIAARILAEAGKDIDIFICGDKARISGNAERALTNLDRHIVLELPPHPAQYDLIIDAIFGAGIDREIKGETARIIYGINQCDTPVVSVDLPSGIDGKSGHISGCAIEADHTVTFFRWKPGHLLFPGRLHCGRRHVCQIGIDATTIVKSGHSGFHNHPDIWLSDYPLPTVDGHKYNRGHTLVLSGPVSATGAARLTAHGALRSGCGLVTIASPAEALTVNAAHLTSIMLQQADSPTDIGRILEDQRINCIALGPGLPPDETTVNMVLKVLDLRRTTVLDAGALVAFATNPQLLFDAIKSACEPVFLTPHDGEFSKLFFSLSGSPSKIDRAQEAANASGATIMLKGPDTVVATPDGQISVSDNAPPWLATAGSGDVLTGVVAGLKAQGMSAFEAANAAVWLHADAANQLGPGLVSSDLDEGLRLSIKKLISEQLGTAD